MNKKAFAVVFFLVAYVAAVVALVTVAQWRWLQQQPQPLDYHLIRSGSIDIVQSRDSLGMPLFEEIDDVRLRKEAFFTYFDAHIEAENQYIRYERARLLAIVERQQQAHELSKMHKHDLSVLRARYRIKKSLTDDEAIAELLLRVDVVPRALVLAQAAIESGWGRSRFAKNGHNYFGQRCYRKSCGMVPKKRKSNKVYEVTYYATPKDSLRSYVRNLNVFRAYADFRVQRAEIRRQGREATALELTGSLLRYSERGEEYVTQVANLIRANQLE